MKQIPETENSLVLRTDFSNDAAWEAVCKAIQAPVGDFQANVDCLSDAAFKGLSAKEVMAALTKGYNHFMLFVVDDTTLAQADHPVLCIDLSDKPGRSFRVIPSEMWSVENNLSLGNMDFKDFAGAVDQDEVFRGFPAA